MRDLCRQYDRVDCVVFAVVFFAGVFAGWLI